KALRADPEHADTPVLILTARGQSHDRQMALDLRADGFISKPFANDEVVDEVRRLLGQRAARMAALG
ncbi:MAG TPA: response regulator, partial [Paracoccus sp.]|nr:response regulator [Paracoccus sp. (in: a-proteobacteria)]